MSCYVIAEIGINHAGSYEMARAMIDVAKDAGCDAVKFQKRTVNLVYTKDELAKERPNPFGPTNGDLKRGLEFSEDIYHAINAHCRKVGIQWGASCWDPLSVDIIAKCEADFLKVASPTLTDTCTVDHIRTWSVLRQIPVYVSCGMSTTQEVSQAIARLKACDIVLMHCVSSYPVEDQEVHLRWMDQLRCTFNLPVGYSGHSATIYDAQNAVARGACCVEKHITLDRAIWGSDQKLSIQPDELRLMVRLIRQAEAMLGDGEREVLESELPAKKKLRRM